ncbi:homeobox-leucine zipper protein HAT22-like [Corylus avellana]|uniref:homeobox-leucine zipper protein HAT22-like n=1 Tax=Corylus avellana TaxID=13451 RepID=UPI00286B29C8|nr:homeobox-leucine zipper protein HAT22-like [Corylus avellana]
MEDDEACNTSLRLGLGSGDHVSRKEETRGDYDDEEEMREEKPLVCLDLMFPTEGAVNVDHKADRSLPFGKFDGDDDYPNMENDSDIHRSKDGRRKKLRLSKDQSFFLEDCFKLHSTLSPAQKQAIAGQLNLKPRQVEVWFQNKRARTKLKQTEVDCEFLKKCCANLRDENRRLKRELEELRSLKVGSSPPPYIQLPKAATLRMCPSCEKIVKAREGKNAVVFDAVGRRNKKLQSGFDGTI